MTTPERLRRRQRLESAFIAILAACLVVAAIYFDGRDDAQQKCITTFVQLDSETGAIRSKLVEQESRATRSILLRGTAAKSRDEFQRARVQYVRALRRIDEARAANPVQPFPKGVCD